MSTPRPFDDARFRDALEDFLWSFIHNAEDEHRILRAWDLAQGTMDLHACVDRADDETLEQARRTAWRELWEAFDGKPATFLFWGVTEELQHACQEDPEAFDAAVAKLGRRCVRPPSLPSLRRRLLG